MAALLTPHPREVEVLIRHFLTRPDRRYPYNTLMRWSANLVTVPGYTVTITINQPCTQN